MKSLKLINLKQLLENILVIVHNNKDLSEVINSIGILNKTIGSSFFITPNNALLSFCSISYVNDKIVRIGITLEEDISLFEVQSQFGLMLGLNYSHFDDSSLFTFKIEKDFLVFYKSGYYEKSSDSFKFGKVKLMPEQILSKELELQII